MSTYTYQVEAWSQVRREAPGLFSRHWEEVAVNRDKIKLDPDWAEYDALEAMGQVHCLTVRCDGVIVGYFVAFVHGHIHYKASMSAFTDLYFVAPEHRKGRVGYNLFREAEASLKKRGVEKIFTGTKKHLDMSKLLRRLGYSETETLMTKFIGD